MEERAMAAQFESYRTHLKAVAYRILGSLTEADDAVQETWLRLQRSDVTGVENLRAWLTTVVARVCLDILRSRREESLGLRLPDPIVNLTNAPDPEQEALIAGSVGLALQVVLDTLRPAERIAFVLHDVFAMSFDEISPIVGRNAPATRQLASRARRRIQRLTSVPDPDIRRQQEVVDAFYSATRRGDFSALLVLLDPDVVVRVDSGSLPLSGRRYVRGAVAVAREVISYASFAQFAQPAIVNGAAGALATGDGRLYAIVGFTVTNGRIVEIDILADPERLQHLA
jgi:RNA polymerase sigma-70 factor, ECF subfamily